MGASDIAAPDPPHVLVVEDDETIAEVVCTMLRDSGYVTTWLPTADAARSTLEAGDRFDLVFSDIRMPGVFTGIDLGRWIRAKLPLQPILLTTGYSGDQAGEREFVVVKKPYRLAALLDAVERALLPIHTAAAVA